MNSLEIVGLVAIILISCFAIIGIIVSIPLFKLLNKIKHIADNLNESLTPIIGNLNKSVEGLNSELEEISSVTSSLNSIVVQMEKVIRLARLLVTNPVIKVVSTSAGLLKAFTKK
jgi:predicted PurR-regulated permease PerM